MCVKAKVWVGEFASETEAQKYAGQTGRASRAKCALWREIGIDYFDHDFQETIWGDWKDYLAQEAGSPLPAEMAEASENTAFILYQSDKAVDSTSDGRKVRYVGEICVDW